MGNTDSVPSNINTQNLLIQEIHSVASELNALYSRKYLDPKFCTTIALIYNDKLMNYRHVELNNISMTLGLLSDAPGNNKQQLCDVIVKHYTDRLNLIAAIQYSLSYCSDRIFAITQGPRCDTHPEIFDQPTCSKNKGRWTEYVAPPDQSLEENQLWYKYLNQMQTTYIQGLERLLDILNHLRNFDETINAEKLMIIAEEVELLIKNMRNVCGELYKLMLTTPTYTYQEILMIKQDDIGKQQESAAQKAALRMRAYGQPAALLNQNNDPVETNIPGK
jgi:hypothetical protein